MLITFGVFNISPRYSGPDPVGAIEFWARYFGSKKNNFTPLIFQKTCFSGPECAKMVILTIFVLFRLLPSNYFDLSLHTFTLANTRIELMENGPHNFKATVQNYGVKNVFVIFEFFAQKSIFWIFSRFPTPRSGLSAAQPLRVAP